MEENNKSLLAFSDNIQIDKDICDEDRLLIEVKVWNLLGKRTERYTMGDSTSVPIEMAEELLNSICFSLELELRGLMNVNEILIEEDIEDLLRVSWRKIASLMEEGKKLLEKVRKNSPSIENISYRDTLNEIGEFFNKYDYRFFAHRINCSIDYQLSNPISEKLQGIEYINEYLKALLIENEFCICFDRENIIDILNSYCSDYKGLLINIFEPILTNAIGLDILGEDILTLDISTLQRKELLRIFRSLSKAENLTKLRNSAKRVCHTLGIVDSDKIKYIQNTAANIYPRIELVLSTGNIDNVFLSFKHEEDLIESEFIDNYPMEDERLRDLINEINDCRFIADKIAMIKEEIHSLSDLVEVLSVCLWEDEALELFKTLTEEEISIIKHYLDSKDEVYSSDSKWEIKFMDYIREDFLIRGGLEMKYEEFFNDNKYKNISDKNKILISNILQIFSEKCTKEFYPSWRNDEGNTKVFAIKLKEKLMSKYGSKRENIVTIRLRVEQLDIEVFRGTYCKGQEFPYSLDTTESDPTKLYEDINDLFASALITVKN